MAQTWLDLRLALRLFAKSPGFTAVAVASLALGIGANTTVFSLVNGLLLVPSAGRDPGRLVSIYTSDFSGPLYSASSYPDYLDFKEGTEALEGLAAHTLRPLLVTIDGKSQRAIGGLVTGNAFEVVGLRAAYGRLLLPAECELGRHPVVVLSHAFWRRRFGGDPSVVGRSLALNGQPYTIVGIGPEGFTGFFRGLSTELFVPLAMQQALGGESLGERGNRGLLLVGRLRDKASIEVLRPQLAVIGARHHEAYRDTWSDVRGAPRTVSVLPERDSRVLPEARGAITAFLALLTAVVLLVLVLACSNVANLLVARADIRRREIAIRIAIGARRGQVVRQLLVESLLLSLAGGGLGVGLAVMAMRSIEGIQPPLPVSLALGLALNARVLAFTVAVSVATGLLFGLLPAWRATRADPIESIKGLGAETARRRRIALRDLLVIAQVAGSFVLLIGAGLFLRSLAHAGAIDPGFVPRGVLAFSVDLASSGYDEARGQVFLGQLVDRLSALPGVESVSLTNRLPLSLGGGRRRVDVEGYAPSAGEDMEVNYAVAGAGYFKTMRTPLTVGRGFAAADATGPGVVVVNEAFVRRFWPGRPAIGRRVNVAHRLGGQYVTTPMEVVGVTRDGKYNSLGEEATPFIYYPWSHLYEAEMNVILRSAGAPAPLADPVREAVARLDPHLPVYDVRTLEQHLRVALFPVTAVAWLVGIMGLVAIVLAAIGLHGVLACAVARRRREIGIRMALGASRRAVLGMVVSAGGRLTAIGLGVGAIAALGVTRFLTFLLYGVSPADPATFAGISALLLIVGAGAATVPARRAARVDPAETLRTE
jgi:predicted permease